VLNNPHYNNLGAVKRKFGSAKFHGVSGMKFENLSLAYEKLNRFIGGSGSDGEGNVYAEVGNRQF
jgi:hypothetical protein